MMPLMETFSRPLISGWKPAPSSMRAEMRPSTVRRAPGRLGDAGEQLQQRRLARAVLADDPEGRALRHLEGDAVEGGEGLVGGEVGEEAAGEERALQGPELVLVQEAPVDLGHVAGDDRRLGSHFLRQGVAQAVEEERAQGEDHERRPARSVASRGPVVEVSVEQHLLVGTRGRGTWG